jgi:hypothetical protein
VGILGKARFLSRLLLSAQKPAKCSLRIPLVAAATLVSSVDERNQVIKRTRLNASFPVNPELLKSYTCDKVPRHRIEQFVNRGAAFIGNWILLHSLRFDPLS